MKQIDTPELEFCKKEILTKKQEFTCKQDHLHKSILDNPLAFILFYLFAIIFSALLFQLTQKKNIKKKKSDK